jgi:DNA-directed RNA polymerase beta subunit
MQFKSLKPFRPVPNIIIPPVGIEGKNICFTVITENHSFLDGYRMMGIKKSQVKYVFVPTTRKPKTALTSSYKEKLLSHGLIPIKGFFGVYSKVIGKNFYFDVSNYINYSVSKYKMKDFGTGRGLAFMNNIINSMEGIPENSFQRVLLYSIDLNSPIQQNIRKRKIFSIYNQILKASKEGIVLPFDKLLVFVYNHSGSRFMLLYDKEYPVNSQRIRSIIMKLIGDNVEDTEEAEMDNVIDDVSDVIEDLPDDKQSNIKDAVTNFISSDPTYSKLTSDEINSDEVIAASMVYHATGDPDRAKTIAKIIKDKPQEEKRKEVKKLIKTFSKNLLPRGKAESASTNDIVQISKPGEIVDNKIPVHILQKRKNDFSELLKEDLEDVFKPLEDADIPLKVSNIDVKTIKDPVSELKQTLKDRYFITLVDPDGEKHNVHIDIPHLTENGIFLINGQPRVLVNQLIAYPIFFFKPYLGRFESSYSVINIHSKRLANTSYLMMRMAGYNLPLIMFLGYKLGFEETMKMFGIEYEVSKEKLEGGMKLPDGSNIAFKTDTDVGTEIVQSFRYSIVHFPKNKINVKDENFWRAVLINAIGTRNCTHSIDSIWRYIVTPISREILKSKGDPTTLPEIIKYISEEVVKGTVDDRNSLDKLRIRTSEVFTHTIQKQVLAAYSEYLAKKLGGDKEAKLSINSTKAWSEVVNSPNVQQLETINPLEELSMMTRVTPVGIGGIPDKRALPTNAMNIHYTYYGNIDPLETPDSGMVGIQQHLTVGAAIANSRGTFMIKDHSMVKPTEILSVCPAMVPFVESNDGCRVLFGASQSKQAIPLVNPQFPAVQSGYESLLTPLLSDNFVKKSPVDGKVISIEKNFIVVAGKDGKRHTIETRPRILRSGGGKHGLSVFNPTVKVGQNIKESQILAEGSNIKNGMISNGVNLLCAFMPWKGFNFEDGVVISESAAKKFTSIHMEEKDVYLEEDDDVVFISNIGDKLDKGGILLTQAKSVYDIESFKHARTEGGTIINIEVYSNIEKVPEKLIPIYEDFKRQFIMINGKYPTGTFREKDKKVNGILIKFIVKQELKLLKGDKMNNRHGNKGVVSIVEKDENMPITPWGERIDIVYWPLGIANRMNSGQLAEAHTGLIAKKLAELSSKLSRKDFIKLYNNVLDRLDGTDNKEYSKNIIQKLQSISDSQYKEIMNQIKNDGFVPIMIPPFKSPPRKNIIDALGVIGLKSHYPLELPEFKRKTKPVGVGVVFVQKLEHMSGKKLASRGVGPYVSTTLAPTAGKRRGGGQKIGESDLYGLLSWDCPILIDEFFGPMSGDHITKNEMIAEIVQTGSTEFREPKTNPVKERLGAFMLAIHLESD